MSTPALDPRPRLLGKDYLLLTLFSLVLFGYVAFSGRLLGLHEARLPECVREMMASHEWVIPHDGPRTWLERPPLPHWVTMAVNYLMGQRCETEWAGRLPAALMGVVIVLLVARMATVFFGRGVGVAAGLMLATMWEFYDYATHAEDDIFLAAVVAGAMATWVHQEFVRDPDVADPRLSFFFARPWPVPLFFALLGLTNMAKGPIVGAAVVLGTLGPFFLWERNFRRLRRYLWLPGWILCVVLALAWHVAVQRRYPTYLDNLRFDFSASTEFDQPFWYYGPALLASIAPWTPLALVGLYQWFRVARREKTAAAQFLCCWAVMPILVLSLTHRKHHHYLVPSLAPWAIAAAAGAIPFVNWLFSFRRRKPVVDPLVAAAIVVTVLTLLRHRLPVPGWTIALLAIVWLLCIAGLSWGSWKQDARWLFVSLLLATAFTFSWPQALWPDKNTADTIFLYQADALVPPTTPLCVDGRMGPLEPFRLQFYIRPNARLLQNLTYLRGSDFSTTPDAYVIARAADQPFLATLGPTTVAAQSTYTRRENSPADRFTLFHVVFFPTLQRFTPPPIDPLQAMLRKEGPWCGPPAPDVDPQPKNLAVENN